MGMPIDLFGNDTPISQPTQRRSVHQRKDGSWMVNPMTFTNGVTKGRQCKDCAHLVCKQYSKRYYKCALRENVDKCSPASDHRVRWPACGKFELAI